MGPSYMCYGEGTAAGLRAGSSGLSYTCDSVDLAAQQEYCDACEDLEEAETLPFSPWLGYHPPLVF